MIVFASALEWATTQNLAIIIAVIAVTYIVIEKVLKWKYAIDGDQIEAYKAATFFEGFGLDYLPRVFMAVGAGSLKRIYRAVSSFIDEVDTEKEREAFALKTLAKVIRVNMGIPKRAAVIREAMAEFDNASAPKSP
jgi:hypothetical protein